MTPELIGILSVGAVLLLGLGGLIVGTTAWLRADIRDLRIDLGAGSDSLRADVRDLDRRMARVEGVIEGLAYANGRDRGEGRAA